MKKKELQKYNDQYGEIPKKFMERFNYLLKVVNLSDKHLIEIRNKIKKYFNHKWEKEKYVIFFFPKATARPRLSGFTKKFYVSDAKSNNDTFKKFCEEAGINNLITTPCKLLIETYYPMPNLNKVDTILAELKLIRPLSKPDWDNVGKTYSDMIQNNILLDDSLVIDGRSVKYYSIKPRIEITIEYMTKYDCKYNKNKVEKWGLYEKNKDRIIERDSI